MKKKTKKGTDEIRKFCKGRSVCAEGYEWAIKNCKNMKDVWVKSKSEYLIWLATSPGVLSRSEINQFAMFCAVKAHAITQPFDFGNDISLAWNLTGIAEAAKAIASAKWATLADDDQTAASWAYSAACEYKEAAWSQFEAHIRSGTRLAAPPLWGMACDNISEWLRSNTKPKFKTNSRKPLAKRSRVI